jgi:F-type H+-transporting ATPase subunit b
VNAVTVTFEGEGMLRVLVDGADAAVHQVGQAGEEAPEEGPSPIAIEGKELLWGGGAFLVFLALMRLFLVPRVKKGMEARHQKIRSDLEDADDTRAQAQQEVAEYQAELATVRAEASERIDAARRQLETERADRLAEVNARIATRRAEAATTSEQTRAAARATIEDAVASVASRAVELSVGKRPDPDVVSRAVAEVSGAGVQR